MTSTRGGRRWRPRSLVYVLGEFFFWVSQRVSGESLYNIFYAAYNFGRTAYDVNEDTI